MMPLDYTFRKCTGGYKLDKAQEKINRLIYMDDIKLFAKNEKELETRKQAVRIYTQDTEMEFAIEKCAILIMKSGKRHMTEGVELPNRDKIRTFGEKEIDKYMGILEADTIKHAEMKEKNKKEYPRRTRKILETKLHRNFIKGINTRAVPHVSYSGPSLKSTRVELQQMDQRTRKLMTVHKALHPRDDVDRLYVPRKEEGRGLTSNEDSIDITTRRLHKKAWKKADHCDQKQFRQHNHQRNKNNYK